MPVANVGNAQTGARALPADRRSRFRVVATTQPKRRKQKAIRREISFQSIRGHQKYNAECYTVTIKRSNPLTVEGCGLKVEGYGQESILVHRLVFPTMIDSPVNDYTEAVQLSTFNLQPSTSNFQLSAFNLQPSVGVLLYLCVLLHSVKNRHESEAHSKFLHHRTHRPW